MTGRDVFLVDNDFVSAAHRDHRFFHSVFHAFSQRGHADEAQRRAEGAGVATEGLGDLRHHQPSAEQREADP